MGKSVDWTWLRKEPLSLKNVNRHFPNWNAKRKKNEGKWGTEYPRAVERLQKVQHLCNGNNRKRNRKKKEGIFKVIMTENFSKLMIYTKLQLGEHQGG